MLILLDCLDQNFIDYELIILLEESALAIELSVNKMILKSTNKDRHSPLIYLEFVQ